MRLRRATRPRTSPREQQAGAPPHRLRRSGSENHGTLAEWSAKYPNARILFGGFSLGSGVVGDGVLRSISYGDDRYVFTDDLPPVVVPSLTHLPVTGSATLAKGPRKVVATLRADAQPTSDDGRGSRLRWQILVDGVPRFNAYDGWSGVTSWSWTFKKKSGKHQVVVLKNGKQVAKTSLNVK